MPVDIAKAAKNESTCKCFRHLDPLSRLRELHPLHKRVLKPDRIAVGSLLPRVPPDLHLRFNVVNRPPVLLAHGFETRLD